MLPKEAVRPSEYVRALFCGYRAEVRQRRLLIVVGFKAFGDDSAGCETTERPLVIAAYALPAANWEPFAEDWHTALHLRPEIAYLKMREAEGFNGEFRGMKSRPEFRDLKLNDLAAVIEKHKPYAMHAWVNVAEYEAVLRGRIPPEIDSPYFLVTNALIELALKAQIKYNSWGPLHFVFDRTAGIEDELRIAFKYAKSQTHEAIRDLLGKEPDFEDDLELNPIQAADMLAWHHRRRLERPEEVRSRMDALLAGGCCEAPIDAPAMRGMLLKSWGQQVGTMSPDEYAEFDETLQQMLSKARKKKGKVPHDTKQQKP